MSLTLWKSCFWESGAGFAEISNLRKYVEIIYLLHNVSVLSAGSFPCIFPACFTIFCSIVPLFRITFNIIWQKIKKIDNESTFMADFYGVTLQERNVRWGLRLYIRHRDFIYDAANLYTTPRIYIQHRSSSCNAFRSFQYIMYFKYYSWKYTRHLFTFKY